MTTRASATPDDIDITSLWAGIRRAVPKVLLASLVVGGAAFAILSMMPQRYTSEARLQIGGKGLQDPFRDPKGANPTTENVAIRVDREAIQSQVQVLQSRDLAERLIADLKLDRLPEYNPAAGSQGFMHRIKVMLGIEPAPTAEMAEDSVLGRLRRGLQVYPVRESRVIVVEASSTDAHRAADIANRLVDLYEERLKTQGLRQTLDASTWLGGRIERLRAEVAAAEAAVEKFRGEAGLLAGSQPGVTLNSQQLQELNTEHSKAAAQRSEAEARARSIRELLKSNSADVSPDVLKSPLIQRLLEQRVRAERQIAELSATLLPGHPRMKQLTADLAGLKTQIKAEVSKVVESLEKEARIAGLREASIKQRLDEQKSRVVRTGGDEVKLRALESEAKSKRAELEQLQASFESARARSETQAVPIIVDVITRAAPASQPSFPKKIPMSALAAAATLILGLGLVLLKSLLTGSRSGAARPVHQAPADRPVQAAETPRLEVPRGPPPRTVPAAGLTRFTTAAEVARHLESRAGAHGAFRTLVTMDRGHPGTAAVAADVARELAARGIKAVVVDCVESGETLASALGLTPAPGLRDVLAGRVSFERAIATLPGSNADIIVAGAPQSGSIAAAGADHLNVAFDTLDQGYAHVLAVADRTAAQTLFEAMEGRFDAGLVLGRATTRPTEDGNGRFLGYQLGDFEVLRLEQGDQGARTASRATATTKRGQGAQELAGGA